MSGDATGDPAAVGTADGPAAGTADGPAAGTVAVLGAGVMGETLLSGLLRGGRSAADIVVTERRPERAAELRERYGVRVLDNVAAVAHSRTVLLVVKPQDMTALLAEIAPHVDERTLLVSLAAGVTTRFVESRLPAAVPVVRVMPNTPALVDAGMSAITAGANCSAGHLDEVEALLCTVSDVVRVPEHQIDAVTAVSGSGPAYIFYVVEAMIEAGVVLGLSRDVATRLAVGTVRGAGVMIAETGQHPTVLREQVSSPAGTTVAAVRVLDDHRVRAAFVTAMVAARDRSAELGRALEG